jgi:hypothetical protein
MRNRNPDRESKIEDTIKGQTKWHSLKEFLELCGAVVFFVLIVWAIDYRFSAALRKEIANAERQMRRS